MNTFIFQKSDKFPFLKFVVKLELRHFNQTVVNSSIFSRTDSAETIKLVEGGNTTEMGGGEFSTIPETNLSLKK